MTDPRRTIRGSIPSYVWKPAGCARNSAPITTATALAIGVLAGVVCVGVGLLLPRAGDADKDKLIWEWGKPEPSPYQLEWDHLVEAIRKPKPPKPGSRWRLLAHHDDGYVACDVTNAGEFDELCVDGWLHIERMSDRTWWAAVETTGGTVHLWFAVGRDGKATVTVSEGAEHLGGVRRWP